MINAIENDKPAIAGVLDVIEKFFGDDTIDHHSKKSFGAWVAFILQPFGHIKTHSKKLGNNSRYFSSASCFMKGGVPTKELVIEYKIREI